MMNIFHNQNEHKTQFSDCANKETSRRLLLVGTDTRGRVASF